MPDKPIPTVGHHFSDLLICKQKAWLHYHGDTRQKMRPPAHLRAMQEEGLELEAQIYKNRYVGAVKIPGIGTKSSIRSEKTREAMQKGEPAILQGFVETPLGNGTIDVMEKIGPDPESVVGFAYRVGEIKRSEKLMTAHVMQAFWYTELLEQAYGQKNRDVFFFLGGRDDQVHHENLDSYQVDYQAIKNALFELRDKGTDPGPHLIPACQTCDWRGVCMPRLVRENHPSLLPELSQNHVLLLRAMGVEQWQDLGKISDDVLAEMGIGSFAITLIRKSGDNLAQGLAALRNNFRVDLFDNAAFVSVEFEELKGRRKKEDGSSLRPIRIHWADHHKSFAEDVHYDSSGNGHVDLSDLTRRRMLVLYGGTDIGAFARILRQNQSGKPPRLFDLFEFVEKHVHAPFLGLELPNVLQYITHEEAKPEAAQRAMVIREVAGWIARSL